MLMDPTATRRDSTPATAPAQPRILVVDPHAAAAARMRDTLLDDGAARPPVLAYEVDVACRLSDAVSRLREAPADVILLALALPDSSGLATLAAIRLHAPHAPVVVLVPRQDEVLALKAVRDGALDYLVTDELFDTLLTRAVRYAVERAKADREGRESERRFRSLSVENARTAETLRAAEQRYRAAFEQGVVGMVHVDLRGNSISVNDRACELLGFSRDELFRQTLRGIAHPDDLGPLATAFGRVLAGECTEYRGEHGFVRKDGSLLWATILISLVRTSADAPAYLSVVLEDCTERQHARHELRAAEAHARRLIELLPAAVYTAEPRPPFARLFVSPVLESFGFSSEEWRSPGLWADTLHPEDRPAVLERTAGRYVAGWQDQEYRGRDAGGRVRWIHDRGRLVHDPGGDYWLGVMMDVTERKAAEARVAAREAAIAGAQAREAHLRQAQKLEAVGRLADGVAHDFNDALTVVMQCADAILARPHGDGTNADAREIHAAATRMAARTQQLLTFSRRQQARPQLVDVDSVVRDMAPALMRLAGEGVEVRTALAAPTPAELDPAELEQLLMHLVANAGEAMPAGGALDILTDLVEVGEEPGRVRGGARRGPHVRLTVRDVGHGMDKETWAHAFDPFYTTRPGATGLGLSAVYGAARRWGGWVDVASEVGAGSAVSVYVPAAGIAAPGAPGAPGAGARGEGAPATLLVVEDEAPVRRVLKRTLEARGYAVLEAAGGAEALQVARAHAGRIDLLLADVLMPGLTGPQLFDELQAERDGLHVLYMSGYSDDAITRHGALPPGAAFVAKPFSLETIVRRVSEELDRGRILAAS